MAQLILIFKFTFLFLFSKGDVPFEKVESFAYKNKPAVIYKCSGNKDVMYKIVLYADASQNKVSQTLIIRKADDNIKMMLGANYILSEMNANSQYINYPYAWESLNVNIKDLKEDCINIFDKKIQPLKTN